MRYEDLPQEYLDEIETYSVQELQLKVFRQQQAYNRQAGRLVDANRKMSDLAADLDESIQERDAAIDVANFQDDMLQVLGEYLDYWLNMKTEPGSRARSIQIAVEALATELESTHTMAMVASAAVDDEIWPWERDDEAIHALQEDELDEETVDAG